MRSCAPPDGSAISCFVWRNQVANGTGSKTADDLIQPVRIVIAAISFGNGVAIYDERLRERRRLYGAPIFLRGHPIVLDFGMTLRLRVGCFSNRKLDMKRPAPRKRELGFFEAPACVVTELNVVAALSGRAHGDCPSQYKGNDECDAH